MSDNRFSLCLVEVVEVVLFGMAAAAGPQQIQAIHQRIQELQQGLRYVDEDIGNPANPGFATFYEHRFQRPPQRFSKFNSYSRARMNERGQVPGPQRRGRPGAQAFASVRAHRLAGQRRVRLARRLRQGLPPLTRGNLRMHMGNSNKLRSTKGGVFWQTMRDWNLKLSASFTVQRRTKLIKRIRRFFRNDEKNLRMFLEAGHVREYGQGCAQTLPPAPPKFRARYIHLIKEIFDLLRGRCNRWGWRKRSAYPRRAKKPQIEDAVELQKGSGGGVIQPITDDMSYARKVAAAKHRLRMLVLNKKYDRTALPAGKERPVVRKAQRRCDPSKFSQTSITVRMKRTKPSIDRLGTRADINAALDKLKSELQRQPEVLKAVRAWSHDAAMLDTAFTRRQGTAKTTRLYPHPESHLSRGVRKRGFITVGNFEDVVTMTATLLTMLTMTTFPSGGGVRMTRHGQAVSLLTPYAARQQTGKAIQQLAQQRINIDYVFMCALELKASQGGGANWTGGSVQAIVTMARNSNNTMLNHINRMAVMLNYDPYDICVMLAYTPVKMWGSYTSHTNDRISMLQSVVFAAPQKVLHTILREQLGRVQTQKRMAEVHKRAKQRRQKASACGDLDDLDISHGLSCVSGRATGGTQSKSCGGSMYLQKLPKGYRPQQVQVAAQVNATRPKPTSAGAGTTPPPDVWRGIYNGFKTGGGYEVRVGSDVLCSEGMINSSTLAYAGIAHAPIYKIPNYQAATDMVNVRRYINAVVNERDPQRLFLLLHKDYATMQTI